MSGTDLDTLAARILADLDEVRACLLASGDGDAVGVAPAERSEAVLAAWSRLRSLGEPQRGFLVLEDEMWAFVGRGARMGVVVAAPSAAPGVLLDRLEMALKTADDLFVDEEVPVLDEEVPVMAAAMNGDAAEGASVDVSVLPSEPDEAESEVEVEAPSAPPSVGSRTDRDVDHAALTREFAFLMSDRDERDR